VHGEDRAGARPDRGLDTDRVDIPRISIDVDESRRQAGLEHRLHDGRKNIRRHEHLAFETKALQEHGQRRESR
jgi:hypothetical protein